MQLSTLFRWTKMEDLPNIPLIRLAPSMELVTVMPNAPKFHSLLVKLHLARGEMLELAVQNLTFGRPTNKLMSTLLILVISRVTTSVRGILNVDLTIKGIMEYVIKMDAV